MDGVLTDFVGGILSLHNIDPDTYDPKGSYDIHDTLNMDPAVFWGALDRDEQFWERLSPTPEAYDLMSYLESEAPSQNIYLLTSPALHPNCFRGKAVWVQKHFPQYLSRLILTAHKHFLAAPDRLLIDDSDRNVQRFSDCRGMTVLVPRKWNAKHLVPQAHVLDHLLKTLSEVL